MAEDDVPKSIIVVLVVLAVFISVLSTITILSEVNKLNTAPVRTGSNMGSAQVRLTVEDPNKGSSQVTGQVTLKLVEAE